MLSTALCFPWGIGHCSVWPLRTQVFSKGCCPGDLKAFCEIVYKSVLLNIIENMKQRWLVYYLKLMFTHLLKEPWRTGGWNQKQLGNRLLVTRFFWLYMIIYDYFSSVFCIVPKKVLLLKYRKWVGHLKNRYHYGKVVENARIWKELYQLFFAMAQLAALWMCRDISIEILPIPHWTFTCFSKTAIKALKQGVNFVQT